MSAPIPLTVEQAITLLKQSRLDDLSNGATSDECAWDASYVLLDAYLRVEAERDKECEALAAHALAIENATIRIKAERDAALVLLKEIRLGMQPCDYGNRHATLTRFSKLIDDYFAEVGK
jgi:hypothetical protein